MRPERLAEILPLLYVPVLDEVREPDDRPYLKPASTTVPVTPEAEPERVAPLWLISDASAVFTVAVGSCPRSSPPDGGHS